jgi:hypothetical protein
MGSLCTRGRGDDKPLHRHATPGRSRLRDVPDHGVPDPAEPERHDEVSQEGDAKNDCHRAGAPSSPARAEDQDRENGEEDEELPRYHGSWPFLVALVRIRYGDAVNPQRLYTRRAFSLD